MCDREMSSNRSSVSFDQHFITGQHSNTGMRKCIELQIVEIQKYKWYLGEALRHDPLDDRSMNDICIEWIHKYAADFRKWWESQSEGRCNVPA
jgi:hypothetical protein